MRRSPSHAFWSRLLLSAASASALLTSARASAAPTLDGWASMPAVTTAVGPTSGQFGGTGSGDKLYTLLEGTVTGDTASTLRIDEFDIKKEAYTGRNFLYQLDALGTNIGDMTAIDDHQFLVIERNGNTATTAGAPFKKIFVIDTNVRTANGTVGKTELVDLMNIADPHDLNSDGSTLFTFPYATIESVLVLDAKTLLVANDNNFLGGGGRSAAPDITEFLKIRLDQALDTGKGKAECSCHDGGDDWGDEDDVQGEDE